MKPEKLMFTFFGLFFLLIILISGNTQTIHQRGNNPESVIWQPQFSGTTNSLNSVFFCDDTTGWAVGDNGTILHTSDGGQIWQTQFSGNSADLRTVFFINNTTGWAAGYLGTVLKTTNGGNTWSAKVSSTIFHLLSIYFADINTGWVAGDGGVVLKTSDGGEVWQPLNSPVTDPITSIDFVDSLYGWAAFTRSGATSTENLQTTDGGNSWQMITLPTFWPLHAIDFIDRYTGWTVGYVETIFKTTDGGNNWVAQTGVSTVPETFYSVCFTDANNGWAVGTAGIIAHTDDGGDNWTAQASGTSNLLWDVYFVNPQTGWAVGDHGTILKAVSGTSSVYPAHRTPAKHPGKFALHKNYPNPFNPTTAIRYSIPTTSFVKLNIFNTNGQEVCTLVNGYMPAGDYEVIFHADDLSSGLYLYRIRAGANVAIGKMILIK